jgi:large subunit ribosomal protein L32
MAVPKKKKSSSRSRMRRGSNGSLKANLPNVVINKTTGEYQLPHQISLDGYYNGRKVIVEKQKAETEEVAS